MLYLINWTLTAHERNAAIKRFLGPAAQPPDGVTLRGRWHAIGALRGVALVETDEETALFRWLLQWNDLLQLEVLPAITDEEFGQALQASQAHWWQHE
ncbi:DUF3303 family protein [Crenobacter sp. SG2305]|uniref:DUF3303 domain-containing protein n=1 Tax=Crenobacter oryzisoli TaxID=3056844 RepID=UPI0025AAE7D6|nr:DUF3303 family protein [Crenobacter sp. SG2305]MDN0083094.1 DUF3303 family protein [Crenobacter sp. SG2305]